MGQLLHIPIQERRNDDDPYPVSASKELASEKTLKLIGWIRATPAGAQAGPLFAPVDYDLQRHLQLATPLAFVAVKAGRAWKFYRLKADCMAPLEVADWTILDDKFEVAVDVGFSGRGSKGRWTCQVDADAWEPPAIEERLEVALALRRRAATKSVPVIEKAPAPLQNWRAAAHDCEVDALMCVHRLLCVPVVSPATFAELRETWRSLFVISPFVRGTLRFASVGNKKQRSMRLDPRKVDPCHFQLVRSVIATVVCCIGMTPLVKAVAKCMDPKQLEVGPRDARPRMIYVSVNIHMYIYIYMYFIYV